MKRLHGKIMSVRWQEIVTRPIIMCKCKFDSWNKIQTRDFPRKQRELSSRFSQEALEDQRDNLQTEVTSEVWRRYEQVHDLRRKLSLQALHAEDVTQQQSQEYAGSQVACDRIGSGNTAISRNVGRISKCPIGCSLELRGDPVAG